MGLGLVIGISIWLFPNIQLTGNVTPFDSRLYQGRPLAIAWAGASIAEFTESKVAAFRLRAYNRGPNEVSLHDAYILSGIDSTKIPMDVSTPPLVEKIPARDTAPVPRDTDLALTASFGDLSEAEFLRKWRYFVAVIEFDQTSIRHEFSNEWVIDQISQNHPESRPHVSRRQP